MGIMDVRKTWEVIDYGFYVAVVLAGYALALTLSAIVTPLEWLETKLWDALRNH